MNLRCGGPVLLACLLAVGSAAAGKSPQEAATVGEDEVGRLLISHTRWILYWDRAPLPRPRFAPKAADRSPAVTLEFMRVGRRMVGYSVHDPIHHVECEFPVSVREGGLSFTACVGPEISLTHDPGDRQYPLKGSVGGTLFWLAPSD